MYKSLKFLIIITILYLIVRIVEISVPALSMISCLTCNWGSLADWAMAVTAFIALILTGNEYYGQKRRDRVAVFAEYSKRYAGDENIKVVAQYLIAYIENGELPKESLSIYEKEMFLRFFEEIEMQIESGRMDKKCVEDFFVYYAIAAAMCEEFLQGTELANGDDSMNVWHRYRKLVSMYKHMASGIAADYKKHHHNAKELKIEINYPECDCLLHKLGRNIGCYDC